MIAWRIGGRTTYALEGAVFVAGAAVQWLRDGLGIIASAAETDGLARSVPDTGGVYFVPAFVGLGAPYWDQHARGTIVGLTRGTTRAHLARAALEAIAFQSRDVLEAMAADAKSTLRRVRVDGGAVANDFLCQFQADVIGAAVGPARARPCAPPPRAGNRTGLSGDGAQGRRPPPASGMPRSVRRPSLRSRHTLFAEATRPGAGWPIRSADVPAAQGGKRRVLRRRQRQAGRGSGGARRSLSRRQAHGGCV